MTARISSEQLQQLIEGASRATLEGVLLSMAARPYDRDFIAHDLCCRAAEERRGSPRGRQ